MRPSLATSTLSLLSVLAVLGVCAPGTLRAHPGHKGSERLLKLDLAAEPARFAYALVLSPEDAAEVRSAADRNHDGTLDEAEARAAQAALTQDFGAKVDVCRGPSLAETTCRKAEQALLLEATSSGFESATAPLALSWEIALGLDADDAAVRVQDSWARASVVSSTGLIEPGLERVLLHAGADPRTDKGVDRELSWQDATEQPRILFAVWERPLSPWTMPMISGGLLMLSLSVFFVLRRPRT